MRRFGGLSSRLVIRPVGGIQADARYGPEPGSVSGLMEAAGLEWRLGAGRWPEDDSIGRPIVRWDGGGRGIRTPGTLPGSVVFKASQGWEGRQPLPIYPNKMSVFCT
jgi:hypothetical protein